VTAIYLHTPASDAGVRVGDEVLSLDGKPADALSDDEYWGKLEGPLGRKLNIALRPPGSAVMSRSSCATCSERSATKI